MDNKQNIILLVAEDSISVSSLADALGSNNQVIKCRSNEEAENYLKETDVDLIIAAINSSSGEDANYLRHLRESRPNLPLILISDSRDTAIIPDSEIAGVITGPFRIGRIEEMINGIFEERKGTQKGPEEKGKSLLVVDDDEVFRTVLINTLTLSGYSVKGAADGKMALEIIEKGGIDTVITDVNMPHMDGLSLLNNIKKNHPEIPVILITGYLSANQANLDDPYEPDGFLMKPFNVNGIIELLEKIGDTNN